MRPSNFPPKNWYCRRSQQAWQSAYWSDSSDLCRGCHLWGCRYSSCKNLTLLSVRVDLSVFSRLCQRSFRTPIFWFVSCDLLLRSQSNPWTSSSQVKHKDMPHSSLDRVPELVNHYSNAFETGKTTQQGKADILTYSSTRSSEFIQSTDVKNPTPSRRFF